MDVSEPGFQELFQDVSADLVGVVDLEEHKESSVFSLSRGILPGARSAVVLASEILPEVIRFFTSQRSVGALQLSDIASRIMELVSGHLDWDAYTIAKKLNRAGYRVVPLPAWGAPFDLREIRGVIPYGQLARMAGLGTTGWHSMLLTPEFGARVRLAALLTDALLPAGKSPESYYRCPEFGGACVKICPAGAISLPDEAGHISIDRFKCNNMIESSGGCSECLKICPAGKRTTFSG